MTVISVGRNGQEIGDYNLNGLKQGLASGFLLPDDLAWYEGLTEWIPLSQAVANLEPQYSPPPLPHPPPVPHPATTSLHDWHQDSATEKQIAYLASFGVTVAPGITKGQASELIDKCVNDPRAQERRQYVREARYEQEQKQRAMFPSYSLRMDIAAAERELAEIQNDSDSTRDDIKDGKDELRYRQSARIDFWAATFHDNWVLKDEDEVLIDFAEAIDSYSKTAHLLKTPTKKQISDVLAALDKASPDWDKQEPTAFYTALKANFP